MLTTYSGGSALVYLSSVLVHSLLLLYRYLTDGHLGCKSCGSVSYTGGRVNNREKKKRKKEL